MVLQRAYRQEDTGGTIRSCADGVCIPNVSISRCGTTKRLSGAGIAQTVDIPTPVFVGILAFTMGVIFGPPLLAWSQGGRDYLTRSAAQKFA